MNRPLGAALALLAGCGTAVAADDGAAVRWDRTSVRSVSIVAGGLGEERRDPLAESRPCTTFQPTRASVVRFFGRAGQLSRHAYLHEADWSACHVHGRLVLRDGRTAEWTILRFGTAVVTLGDREVFLVCEPCASTLDPRPR